MIGGDNARPKPPEGVLQILAVVSTVVNAVYCSSSTVHVTDCQAHHVKGMPILLASALHANTCNNHARTCSQTRVNGRMFWVATKYAQCALVMKG